MANASLKKKHSNGVLQVADLQHVRFDKALAKLHEMDDFARVTLDTQTGLAVGVDGLFGMTMPSAAKILPATDRAAAAAVLFLDRFGALFGIAGWHVLSPVSAAPIGSALWFTFEAKTSDGKLSVNVCADEEIVTHVRVRS